MKVTKENVINVLRNIPEIRRIKEDTLRETSGYIQVDVRFQLASKLKEMGYNSYDDVVNNVKNVIKAKLRTERVDYDQMYGEITVWKEGHPK